MAQYYRFADIAKKLDGSIDVVNQWAKDGFKPEALKEKLADNYNVKEVARILSLNLATGHFHQALMIEKKSIQDISYPSV